jgi:type VI secretion system protein ImpG
MTFERSFREELAFLREMGREMALRHPGLCDTLASPGSDPDVERLLEGFAFIAARTRERADDAIPEVIESLAEVVAPHALRPIPASTVVELTPRGALVRDRIHVAKGAAFGSRPVDGIRCELRSTMDVDLLPLQVERAVLDRNRPRAARLVISLRAPSTALGAIHDGHPLRFFLHAPLAAASTLALAIDRHLSHVSVRAGEKEQVLDGRARLIDPDRVPHLAWPDDAPDGARHLAELAFFPERHLFFEIGGLERIAPAARTERFDLCLHFAPDAPLPDQLAEDAVRLHCVPAINLFPCDAEPIRWGEGLRDVLLRGSGLAPSAVEVFDVASVVGLAEGGRGRTAYRSFAALDGLGIDGSAGFFALRRARSVLDGCVDTFVRVGARKTSGAETLSVELRCTNRAAIAKLRTGDVCEPITGSPASATFTNLLPLGPRASARVGAEALYGLVGAVGAGHRCRLTAAALRSRLCSLAVPAHADVARARACRVLADAIRGVHERPFHAARRGIVERGVTIELELDEASLPSIGEAFLLARALDLALAAELPLNVRHQLCAVLVPSRTTIRLDARSGVHGA